LCGRAKENPPKIQNVLFPGQDLDLLPPNCKSVAFLYDVSCMYIII